MSVRTLLAGLYLLLSPLGLWSASRQWSTRLAAIVGVVVAGLQVSLAMSFAVVAIAEPFRDYEDLYRSALVMAVQLGACISPFALLLGVIAIRLSTYLRDSRALRVALLAHVPLTSPLVAWLWCRLALQTRSSSFNFFEGGKPDWIYSSTVEMLASEWVGVTLLGAALVISCVALVVSCRRTNPAAEGA